MDMGYGFWPLAVLMIVIASWLLYRYVAPKGWKEWGSVGLVQAFIIALYAEMYGFPLTLYVLTGFFGVDIPIMHMKGHLWSTLLGYGVVGNYVEMFLGFAFVFFGIGLLIEGWREVYKARQEDRLVTDGLYGLVRHPQYTGIFIALFGQLIHWPTIITVALFPVIVGVYVQLARKEERQMIEQFGERYEAYRQRVPMFFPRWGAWRDLIDKAQLFSPEKNPQEHSGQDQHHPMRTDGHKMDHDGRAEDHEPIHQKEKNNGTADAAEREGTRPPEILASADVIYIDLPALLPDVPDADDPCVHRLIGSLNVREGFEQVFAAEATIGEPARLCIRYDPHVLIPSRSSAAASTSASWSGPGAPGRRLRASSGAWAWPPSSSGSWAFSTCKSRRWRGSRTRSRRSGKRRRPASPCCWISTPTGASPAWSSTASPSPTSA